MPLTESAGDGNVDMTRVSHYHLLLDHGDTLYRVYSLQTRDREDEEYVL